MREGASLRILGGDLGDIPVPSELIGRRFTFPDLSEGGYLGDVIRVGNHGFVNSRGQIVRVSGKNEPPRFLDCQGREATVIPTRTSSTRLLTAVAQCGECNMTWPSSHYLEKSRRRRRKKTNRQ